MGDAGLSTPGVPILADQLTPSQPGRGDYAHHIIRMTSTVTQKEKGRENVFNQIVSIHKEKRKENYFTVRCYVCKLDFSEYGEYKQHMFSFHQFIKTSIEQSFSNEEKLQNETGNRNFAIMLTKVTKNQLSFPNLPLMQASQPRGYRF